MSVEGSTTIWDLQSARDLLRALSRSLSLPAEYSIASAVIPTSHLDTPVLPLIASETAKVPRLGNFDAYFEYFEKPVDILPQNLQPCNLLSSSLSDSYSTPASSPPDEEAIHFDNFVEPKTEKSGDEERAAVHREIQSPRIRRLSRQADLKDFKHSDFETAVVSDEHAINKHRQPDRKVLSSSFPRTKKVEFSGRLGRATHSDFETESDIPQPSILRSAQRLTPAWVTPIHLYNPILSAAPQILVAPTRIKPLKPRTVDGRRLELAKKLHRKHPIRLKPRKPESDESSFNLAEKVVRTELHIFVDSSNITIGFYNALKKVRGLNKNALIKRPPLDFHSLTIILERGRSVVKRILVGSSSRSYDLPDYMKEAVQCGYEVSLLKRVEKHKDLTPTKNGRRRGDGYGTSGQSSGSEAPALVTLKVTEQAVDEILHMKMLESIVDSETPSTMVLATGDAAEAEYSGGFLKNVERALAKGWKVELVAWRDSTSRAYTSTEFIKRWKAQFAIIALDDYCEELLAL